MRVKYARLLLSLVVIINFLIFYFTWKFLTTTNLVINLENGLSSVNINNFNTNFTAKPNKLYRAQIANKHIKSSITIIFRDFYHFENDLKPSISSILGAVSTTKIFVIYDEVPYPPLEILNVTNIREKVKFISLDLSLDKSARNIPPLEQIKTPYVLLLPDSVRINGRSILQKVLREVNNLEKQMKSTSKKLLILPFHSNNKQVTMCEKIFVDLPRWTIEYTAQNLTTDCDMFVQKHAILAETSLLKTIPHPFVSPFPENLYIRAKAVGVKLQLLNTTFSDGRNLFTAYHTKQEKKELRKQHFRELYKNLKIKKVIQRTYHSNQATLKSLRKKQNSAKNGKKNKEAIINDVVFNITNTLLTTTTYFGCEKNTKNCIGQVFNRRPFYLYIGRHTPPCCLEKLRTVFHHVIEELENIGIRYWLDNEALRSAIETNQLSPDAYEIDISFNYFDLQRSSSLKKCQVKPFVDDRGFYWIKATDGNYFKVQYSKQNQIGVNLLPYNIFDATKMATANGFYGWKAKDFSLEFLHPMSTVLFMGRTVACPNNILEYLETKNIPKITN